MGDHQTYRRIMDANYNPSLIKQLGREVTPWNEDKWVEARERGSMKIGALVHQREALYNKKTLQMHGKNRQMLLGYHRDNSKGTSPKPAKEYTPDPATRYNAPLF